MAGKSYLFPTLLAVVVLASSPGAQAQHECSAYAPDRKPSIDSLDITYQLGEIPLPARKLRFTYVGVAKQDPFWGKIIDGMTEEASKDNVSVDVVVPTNRNDEAAQLTLAQAALDNRPDALLLSPLTDRNLKPLVDAARERNVPTIVVNAPMPGGSTYIGTDQPSLGSNAAEYLHEMFPYGAVVGEMEGTVTSPYSIERNKGFTASLAHYPNIRLVAVEHGEWVPESSRTATLAMMKAHPEIQAVYANSDAMALGIVDALRSLATLNKVVVVGTDGVTEGRQSIRDHGMRASSAQFPIDEGKLGVQAAIRILGCQPIPIWIQSQQAVITLKSLADYD